MQGYRMSTLATRAASLALVLLAGCGAQTVLLGTSGGHLFVGYDQLVTPGEETVLEARLQSGDLLSDRPGHAVRFLLDGRLYGITLTDREGMAQLPFTPQREMDYFFIATPTATGFWSDPPSAVDVLVACRRSDAPLLIVDIDRTLVESGFTQVLLGEPQPMPHSVPVMQRLAKEFCVVYLTHRPELFSPKSKLWLCRNGYPAGPVLLADVEGFIKGSSGFKSARLAELSEKFTNIRLGIGDLVTDVLAYRSVGAGGYLILHPHLLEPEELLDLARQVDELPQAIQVVTGWDEIEQGIFEGRRFPPGQMAARLRELARSDAQ